MKTLAQQMAVYNAYHLNAKNKATHFIGVPLIVLALMIPLAWASLRIGGIEVTASMVLVGVVTLYYLMLDIPLGILTGLAVVPLWWAGREVATQGPVAGWSVFALAFTGGWIFQLAGHLFEGRRPALIDNFFQIFVAPLFLVAEVLFALGARGDLKREVESLTVRAASTTA